MFTRPERMFIPLEAFLDGASGKSLKTIVRTYAPSRSVWIMMVPSSEPLATRSISGQHDTQLTVASCPLNVWRGVTFTGISPKTGGSGFTSHTTTVESVEPVRSQCLPLSDASTMHVTSPWWWLTVCTSLLLSVFDTVFFRVRLKDLCKDGLLLVWWCCAMLMLSWSMIEEDQGFLIHH